MWKKIVKKFKSRIDILRKPCYIINTWGYFVNGGGSFNDQEGEKDRKNRNFLPLRCRFNRIYSL